MAKTENPYSGVKNESMPGEKGFGQSNKPMVPNAIVLKETWKLVTERFLNTLGIVEVDRQLLPTGPETGIASNLQGGIRVLVSTDAEQQAILRDRSLPATVNGVRLLVSTVAKKPYPANSTYANGDAMTLSS